MASIRDGRLRPWVPALATALLMQTAGLCVAQDGFLQRRSLAELAESAPAECVVIGERELERLRESPDTARELEVRLPVASALIKLQRFAAAREQFVAAVELARELGDREAHMRGLGGLGSASQYQGDFDTARRAYEEGLMLADEAGDEELSARIWNNLGLLHQSQGDYELAIVAYGRALERGDATSTPLQRARRLNNVATLCNDLRQHARALGYLEKARQAFAETGRGETHYRILVNQAVAYRGLGDLDAAERHLERALVLQREAGDERAAANSLANLSLVLADRGEYDSAIGVLRKAIAVYQRLGLDAETAMAHQNLAEILALTGNDEAARLVSVASLEEARSVGLKPVEVAALRTQARAYEAVEQPASALALLRRAEDVESEFGVARASEELAELHAALERGDLQQRVDRLLDENRRQDWALVALVAMFLSLVVVLVRVRSTRRGPIHSGSERLPWPICASCKNVRDESGEWRQVEAVVSEESDMDFSHGICPDCGQKLYAESWPGN